ncbi:MAG: hypothetical protein ACTSPI_05740 [Candidatus Heimdallarchaeaceae archaeon]
MKQLIISSEGYIHTSSVKFLDDKKRQVVRSTFHQGYNLPPNIQIERDIEFENNSSFTQTIRMGQSGTTYAMLNYQRKA